MKSLKTSTFSMGGSSKHQLVRGGGVVWQFAYFYQNFQILNNLPHLLKGLPKRDSIGYCLLFCILMTNTLICLIYSRRLFFYRHEGIILGLKYNLHLFILCFYCYMDLTTRFGKLWIANCNLVECIVVPCPTLHGVSFLVGGLAE